MSKHRFTHYHRFTRDDLLTLAASATKMEVVGSAYIGNIGEPEAKWNEDGSIDVKVGHTPGSFVQGKFQ